MEEMIEEYDKKFGLDEPLWKQYLIYVGDMSPVGLQLLHRQLSADGHRHDRPGAAVDIGLLLTTTLFSWVLGSLLGAFMGWPRAPKFSAYLMPPLLSLNAMPFFCSVCC